MRDVDQRAQSHTRTSIEGWLYKQDTDLMRRWRKAWCAIASDGGLSRAATPSLLSFSDPPSPSLTFSHRLAGA